MSRSRRKAAAVSAGLVVLIVAVVLLVARPFAGSAATTARPSAGQCPAAQPVKAFATYYEQMGAVPGPGNTTIDGMRTDSLRLYLAPSDAHYRSATAALCYRTASAAKSAGYSAWLSASFLLAHPTSDLDANRCVYEAQSLLQFFGQTYYSGLPDMPAVRAKALRGLASMPLLAPAKTAVRAVIGQASGPQLEEYYQSSGSAGATAVTADRAFNQTISRDCARH